MGSYDSAADGCPKWVCKYQLSIKTAMQMATGQKFLWTKHNIWLELDFLFLKNGIFNRSIPYELSNADVAMATIVAQMGACKGQEGIDLTSNGYILNGHQDDSYSKAWRELYYFSF